jgi:hypothetical protein
MWADRFESCEISTVVHCGCRKHQEKHQGLKKACHMDLHLVGPYQHF